MKNLLDQISRFIIKLEQLGSMILHKDWQKATTTIIGLRSIVFLKLIHGKHIFFPTLHYRQRFFQSEWIIPKCENFKLSHLEKKER